MISLKGIVGSFATRKERPAQDRFVPDAGQQGFTLVEMLVVITIIGLIMGLIGPRVLNYLSESKVKALGKDPSCKASRARSDLFYLDAGRFLYPHRKDWRHWSGRRQCCCGLEWALSEGRVNVPNDPWNNGYVYRSPGSTAPMDIISYGSDGQ